MEVEVSVEAALISPIILFYGLVDLRLQSYCFGPGGWALSLTDDDIVEVTVALPHLGYARLLRRLVANPPFLFSSTFPLATKI